MEKELVAGWNEKHDRFTVEDGPEGRTYDVTVVDGDLKCRVSYSSLPAAERPDEPSINYFADKKCHEIVDDYEGRRYVISEQDDHTYIVERHYRKPTREQSPGPEDTDTEESPGAATDAVEAEPEKDYEEVCILGLKFRRQKSEA